jgi:hypothetical protein
MARLAISLSLVLAFGLLLQGEQRRKEYFTEDELDLVRDAQELSLRIPVYFDLAERRLIILGLTDKSEKQKEKERKAQEKYEKDKKKAGDKASTIKEPEDDLDDFTRSELLRGYAQALDEVMSNIDDYHDRKLDVRPGLESLEKFTRDTLPMLEKYQAKNETEKAALQEAIDRNKEANRGAKDAMKTIPKTEKRPTPNKP